MIDVEADPGGDSAEERQEEMTPAIKQAEQLMAQFQVPVVIEVMLERVTNIAMGTEIDAINEFEPLAESVADAPTAIAAADSQR